MLYPLRRRRVRTLTASLCILLGLWWIVYSPWNPPDGRIVAAHRMRHQLQTQQPEDVFIDAARKAHEARILLAATDFHGAAHAYRQRRGRHPPPGFDKWYARASASRAFVVESFFDQIYEDLEPFWGVKPGGIRGALGDWKWTLRIRNGKVRHIPQGRFRSRIWGDVINQVASDLPDMDVAINPLDEPRVLVPLSRIDALIHAASQQRERAMSLPVSQMLDRPTEGMPRSSATDVQNKWITKGALWPYILDTCRPAYGSNNTGTVPSKLLHNTNWTTVKDICANHDWADLRGNLIRPATMSISTELLPIFSAAKLQGSNDILLPPPAYYTDDVLFTGKGWFGDGKTSTPWHDKRHGLVWRGKATGGLVDESTVEKSHRQRLVSMLNASGTLRIHGNDSLRWAQNAGKPNVDHATVEGWLRTTADAGFTDTMCPPPAHTEACSTMSHRFRTVSPIAMKKQYHWKYLPDIDGNSLSGCFRAFLLSNSAPMKATVFKEWHDHRLVPWVHFIPISITLQNLWSTMAYFLGFPGSPDHDFEGERIATEGRLWAGKVLRKEDMLLYVHRVLLEYGRLCDDDRDRLGFTADVQV